MKYSKFLIIILGLSFLFGCQRYERDEDLNVEVSLVEFEHLGELTTLEPAMDIFLELEQVEMKPLLVRGLTNASFSELSLLDLTTGTETHFHDFDERIIDRHWDLGGGYYAVWGGDVYLDEDEFWQRDFEIIIFDSQLVPVEVLAYDEDEFPWLFGSLMKLVDGELFVYGPVNGIEWSHKIEYLRVNVHTGESEVIFEGDESISFIKFIDDHLIFISQRHVDVDRMINESYYGILDLTTGEIDFFETDNFHHVDFDFHDSKVLLTELNDRDETRNEILILDFETMSSRFIEVKEGDSTLARFSYDGNYIVTINQNEDIIRKYNREGVIVLEMEIELPPRIELNWGSFSSAFEIFPITNEIYSIHSRVYPFGLHIQFIKLL